jgi:hypothetical protein
MSQSSKKYKILEDKYPAGIRSASSPENDFFTVKYRKTDWFYPPFLTTVVDVDRTGNITFTFVQK